jgi:hypothetical protein
VILTFDGEVSSRMWLIVGYLAEVSQLKVGIVPDVERVMSWLDDAARVAMVQSLGTARSVARIVPAPQWAGPRSCAARRTDLRGLAPAVVSRVVNAVVRELDNGAWTEHYGHLRDLDEYDGACADRRQPELSQHRPGAC